MEELETQVVRYQTLGGLRVWGAFVIEIYFGDQGRQNNFGVNKRQTL